MEDYAEFLGVMDLHAAGEGKFRKGFLHIHRFPAVIGTSPRNFRILAERNGRCRMAVKIIVTTGLLDDPQVEEVVDVCGDGVTQGKENTFSFSNSEFLLSPWLNPKALALTEFCRPGGMEALA